MTGRKAPQPDGPSLVYVAPDGTPTTIDETAVDGARDRVLCRALLRNPVGFG